MATQTTEPQVLDKAPAAFEAQHVYQTWHVLSRNPNFAGETCRLNFSNGEAVLPALPASAKCPHESLEVCGIRTEGQYCRVHQRMMQLNALLGYPYIYRVQNARKQTVTRREPGYRFLSEAQYEAEFAEREHDGAELPEDF